MDDKYKELREKAYIANMELPRLNLVLFTFGNVSVVDRSLEVFAIKPSGVPYQDLTPEKIVIVDFYGTTISGNLRPSSDTTTHAVLYREWKQINSIVHTHSTYATAWAQSLRDIPVYGTTHADYVFCGIPCSDPMDDDKIQGDYEVETGYQIIKCFQDRNLDYREVQLILLGNHAPFTWGTSPDNAVNNSAILEELARMAYLTEQIQPNPSTLKESLIRKHYERKHGPNKYYGQSC
jgi:L-ribulose-5-phosphate 4-epimerase